jgi:hypothetical protein
MFSVSGAPAGPVVTGARGSRVAAETPLGGAHLSFCRAYTGGGRIGRLVVHRPGGQAAVFRSTPATPFDARRCENSSSAPSVHSKRG